MDISQSNLALTWFCFIGAGFGYKPRLSNSDFLALVRSHAWWSQYLRDSSLWSWSWGDKRACWTQSSIRPWDPQNTPWVDDPSLRLQNPLHPPEPKRQRKESNVIQLFVTYLTDVDACALALAQQPGDHVILCYNYFLKVYECISVSVWWVLQHQINVSNVSVSK